MPSHEIVLSVIVTCFNYGSFVRDAIDSVLAQECRDLEIIVIDDGSTDDSWAKIEAYGSRITAVRTQNRGALSASLTGFSLSKGQFIYFLDADDLICPGAIKQLRPHLHGGTSKIQFMLLPINKAGQPLGPAFPKLVPSETSVALIRSIAERGYYLTPPTSGNIYRRDVYDDLGDLSYERAIDGIPYLLAPFVGDVVSIDHAHAKYRIHDANLSAFSTLSAARMSGYADRFSRRLDHLQQLVNARGYPQSFAVRADYAYLLEMKLMGLIADRKRPTLALTVAYLRAVRRERSGLPRLLLSMFGIALFSLPPSLGGKLVEFRLNPSKRPWIRSKLKDLIALWT